MRENLKPQISVIGYGNVAMRYAYAVMIKGLCRRLVIVGRDKKKLQGEVMDLSHGMPFISPIDVIAGDYEDIAGSDLVVITVGRRQQEGQSRIDLVRDNVMLYKEIIPDIVKYAKDAILLVVTNPVDVLAYAAYRYSDRPAKTVMGSGTVLDSARFRYLLGRHCNVDPRNAHAYILGEHGDSEFAVWSRTMIGGVLFREYCEQCVNFATCRSQEEVDKIFTEVRDSAYKIIEYKQETSYGVGLALARITEAVLQDENSILPISSLINGYYGIQDVYLSVPAVVNKSGVRELFEIGLSQSEQEKLLSSAEAIKNVIKSAGI